MGYYNTEMVEVPTEKMHQFQEVGQVQLSSNIKCPLVFCPEYQHLTVLTMGGTEQGTLIHPQTATSHHIDYWYGGLIKGSTWSYVSFTRNSVEMILNSVEKADGFWCGFLMKDKEFLDLEKYWRRYNIDKIIALKEEANLSSYIWMDLVISWIQNSKTNKISVERLHQPMRNHSLKLGAFYMEIINRSLCTLGHRKINNKFRKTPGAQAPLTRAQKKTLLTQGQGKSSLTLSSNCPDNLCEMQHKSRCVCTIRLVDKVPCIEMVTDLVHIGNEEYRHCITHPFAVTGDIVGWKRNFVSFYAVTLKELIDALKIGIDFTVYFELDNE